MANYLGDFALSQVFDTKFTTVAASTGAPTTLSGTPAISVYKGNSTTQSTSGVTLSADFDGVTGLNNVRIDLSSDGTFYATANDFQIIITTGTVGGTSAVGYVVGEFSINNRTPLRPTTAGRTVDISAGGEAGIDWANIGSPTTTVNLSGTSTLALEPTTAGRKLDVSAGGEAGLDWANIGSPTTAQNLSGTNIDTDQVVASVTGAVGSVTGAVGSVTGNVGGNVNGNVVGSVGSVVADVGITQAGADKVFGASGAAMAELSVGAPTATPNPRQAAMLHYMALRNKLTTDATTKTLFNDSGTAIAAEIGRWNNIHRG